MIPSKMSSTNSYDLNCRIASSEHPAKYEMAKLRYTWLCDIKSGFDENAIKLMTAKLEF